MDDGAPTRADVHDAAVRTRAMHRDGRRCVQCRPDAGCEQLAWADQVLATLARRPVVGLAVTLLLRGAGY